MATMTSEALSLEALRADELRRAAEDRERQDRVGTPEDYEFWVRDLLPYSVRRVHALGGPARGQVTLQVKFRAGVSAERRQVARGAIERYLREKAPVNAIVAVRVVE